MIALKPRKISKFVLAGKPTSVVGRMSIKKKLNANTIKRVKTISEKTYDSLLATKLLPKNSTRQKFLKKAVNKRIIEGEILRKKDFKQIAWRTGYKPVKPIKKQLK